MHSDRKYDYSHPRLLHCRRRRRHRRLLLQVEDNYQNEIMERRFHVVHARICEKRRLYMPKCAVVHGDAWQLMGITWISPNPQRDLGVTQVRGDVPTHQVKSEVQGDAGHNMSMWMKAPCVSQGYMGVHGSGSTSSSTWSRPVLKAETALHANLSNHAWR